MPYIGDLALPVALILVGIYMVRKAVYDIWEVYSSKNWPSVEGRVVRHYDDPSVTSTARTHRAFYLYAVRGQTYDGNVYFIGSRMTASNELSEFWSRYAVGTPVTVFYNPRKPNESLLVREQDTNWFFFVASLMVLVAGVYFLVRLFQAQ
jgi:hypothetical protein